LEIFFRSGEFFSGFSMFLQKMRNEKEKRDGRVMEFSEIGEIPEKMGKSDGGFS